MWSFWNPGLHSLRGWREPEEELPTSLLIWLLVPYIKPTSKNHYEVFAERASVEKHVSKQNNSLCHFFPTCIPSGNSDFFFFQRVGKKNVLQAQINVYSWVINREWWGLKQTGWQWWNSSCSETNNAVRSWPSLLLHAGPLDGKSCRPPTSSSTSLGKSLHLGLS